MSEGARAAFEHPFVCLRSRISLLKNVNVVIVYSPSCHSNLYDFLAVIEIKLRDVKDCFHGMDDVCVRE